MKNFEQPQESSQPEKEKDGDGKMSRRKFLKIFGIGAVATAGAVGLTEMGVKEVQEEQKSAEQEQKYESEHIRSGEGIVIRKEVIHHDPITMPMPEDQSMQIEQPDTYEVYVKIADRENCFDITKEAYDSYSEGHELTVKYIPQDGNRAMKIISIEPKKQ